MINLSVLLPDIAVKTVFIAREEEFITTYSQYQAAPRKPYVFFGNGEEGYQIVYNCSCIEEVYAASWLSRFVGLELFYEGFLIKELAKLRYSVQRDSFDERFQRHLQRYKPGTLYCAIYDVLFSSLIEYQLKFDFPELSKRLELLYSGVFYRDTQGLSQNNELMMPYIVALENLLRFNSVSTAVKEAFLSFCLPLGLIAKRTDYGNVIAATALIEEWLLGAAPVLLVNAAAGPVRTGAASKGRYFSKEIRAITAQDLADIDRNSRLVSVKAKIESVAKEVGLQAGTGNYLVKANNTTMFFLDTVRKYHKEISELEYLFKKAFTSMLILPAFDGDVNLRRQQQAYLSSLTKEDGKVYRYYVKKKVSVDLMILRDVSGSTYLFETQYAEALVLLLAAVSGFKGIRTLEIDFGGLVRVNKAFEQKVEMSTIFPQSGGGSNILPALRLLQQQKLKGKLRLLFILSDGELTDKGQAEQELAAYSATNNVVVFRIALGEFAHNGYEYVNIRTLHKYLAKKIIETGELQ